MLLAALGNLGQAIAALVATVGIPLAVKQLSTQNRMSQLEVLTKLESMWSLRFRFADDFIERGGLSDERVISTGTLEYASTHYRVAGSETATTVGQAIPTAARLLLPVLPQLGDPGPKSEQAYIDNLLDRCKLVFPLLDSLHRSEDDGRRHDLRLITDVAVGMATAFDEIADLFESRMARTEPFMQRRSVQLMRELHVVEPILLWIEARTPDTRRSSRTLRALALAAWARAYCWKAMSRQKGGVYFRSGIRDELAGRALYGPIIEVSQGPSLLEKTVQGRRLFKLGRELRDPTRRDVHRLIDRAVALRQAESL